MDKETQNEIYSRVKDVIDGFKEDIKIRISSLNELKKYPIGSDLQEEIKELITKLTDAKKITVKDLGISSATKRPLNSFGADQKRYDHLKVKGKLNNQRIGDTKRDLRTDPSSVKLSNKLISLKSKRGRIQRRQLRVSDRIIEEKLKDYLKRKKINLKSVDRLIARSPKIIENARAEVVAEAKADRLRRANARLKGTSKDVVAKKEKNNKEIHRVERQVGRLKNKVGRISTRRANALIRGTNPSLIKKLKEGANKFFRSFSNAYYDARINANSAKIR